MKTQGSHKSLIEETFSKKTLKKNRKAIKAYNVYKKAAKQINALNEASGRRIRYKSKYTSTLNSKLDLDVIGSTKDFQINSRLARVYRK